MEITNTSDLKTPLIFLEFLKNSGHFIYQYLYNPLVTFFIMRFEINLQSFL